MMGTPVSLGTERRMRRVAPSAPAMRAGRVSLALRQDRWYYELTRRGRAELETQTTAWHKLAATISQVLETA
jgi:hypothetical protein